MTHFLIVAKFPRSTNPPIFPLRQNRRSAAPVLRRGADVGCARRAFRTFYLHMWAFFFEAWAFAGQVKTFPPFFSDTRQRTVFYVFLHANTPPATPTSAARRRTARANGVDLRPPLPVALFPSLLTSSARRSARRSRSRLRACSIAVAVACSSRNRRCSAQRHQNSKRSCRCCCCCSSCCCCCCSGCCCSTSCCCCCCCR